MIGAGEIQRFWTWKYPPSRYVFLPFATWLVRRGCRTSLAALATWSLSAVLHWLAFAPGMGVLVASRWAAFFVVLGSMDAARRVAVQLTR